jgi:hypothetical protein
MNASLDRRNEPSSGNQLSDATGATQNLTRTIFWPMTFLKRRFALCWFLIGTLFLLMRVCLLLAYRAEIHIWTELFFAYFIVTGLTAGILYVAQIFDSLPSRLSVYFAYDLSAWARNEAITIFDRRYWPLPVGALWVNVLGTITLILFTRPVRSPLRDAVMILSIQPVFFLCGYTFLFLTKLGLAGRKLVKSSLAINFPDRGNRLVTLLSGYVYFFAGCGLLEYLGLFVAVKLGPTRDSNLMAPWLIGLAVTPIIIFAWGIYHIHILQREIKLKNLETVHSQVRKIFQEVELNSSKDGVEKLAKMIEVQDRFEGAKEWPIALGTVLTLILALTAAVGQILASLNNLFGANTH